MGKRSPAAPPAPDYAGLAKQQGVENLEAAKTSAILSNPNIITPYGQQRVVFNYANQGMPGATTGVTRPSGSSDSFYNEMIAGGLSPEAARTETNRRYGSTAGMGAAYEGTYPDYSGGVTGGAGGETAGNLGYLQPTIIQTVSPTAQRAIEEQERAQASLSAAAAGAAAGLGNLGIASAFRPDNIPGLRYDTGNAGQIANPNSYIPYRGEAGYVDRSFATGDMQFAPNAGNYQPATGFYTEGLPGQMGAGQQAYAGPYAPQLSAFQYGGPQTVVSPTGFTEAGTGYMNAPQRQGLDLSGVGGVGQGAYAGQFGQAGAGPYAGLFGFAGGGPGGVQLQGLDTSGLMGIQGGVGQYGQAQGGTVEGPRLGGLNTMGVGRVQRAPGQGEFGYAQQFVQGPQLQGQIDVEGLAAAPVSAGATAQQAIMSRLAPQLQGERQALYTQLINQGLRPGGEAFNAAMSAQGQKENDLILQAAAQGISLDQAARQQGFAEQQSRAMFANQAQLQGFGAGMEQAGLYNVGLGQNLQQSLATQSAANQAQQQAFQQRLAGAEFGQQTELARFGAGMQSEQARNQAIAQNTQQALATGQFANEAQAQQFAQRLAAGEFGQEAQLASFQTGQQAQQAINQAIAQNFAQGQAAQQMQNQAVQQNLQSTLATEEAQRAAQAQRFGQAATTAELGAQFGGQQFSQQAQLQQIANSAAAQNFQQSIAQREAYNQAQQQAYQQALQGQGFNREALMQQFGMGQQAQQAANAAAAQNFAQQQEASQFNLARQQQQVAQSGAQAEFYNQAQAQAYQRQLAQQAAQNAAQAQRFGQVMDYQSMANQALAQNQAMDYQRLAAQNASQQQQFQQNIANQQFYNTAVQQALAQQAAIRSIPVNEISALLSGGQVNVPQFQGYSGVSVAPAPVFQAGQAAGNFAQQNYQNQVSAYNAKLGMYGDLFGAVGTAAGGGAFSDRRLKSNIVRVGTHPLGIGVYEYDIFGERQRGVMADEVEAVLPEAVATHSSGYKMVYYGML